MKSRLAPAASGSSGMDGEAVVEAQGVSKRYPGRPVLIFPPVVSIFERDLGPFRRRRDATPGEAPVRAYPDNDYDLDDEDDDFDDDGPESSLVGDVPPGRADESFWALRDISFSVRPGKALGVLGEAGAGKSTLLRILSGRAFPTEGRVLLRGTAAPLPAEVQKALAVSGKHGDNLAQACRLLGVHGHPVKQRQAEIEELARPLRTPDGDPARGARMRLAVATAAVLPASVILIEDGRGLDEDFIERVFERLRERLRAGASLVLASRRPELLQELCDEVMVLKEGSIIARGEATHTAGLYQAAPNGSSTARGKENRAELAVSDAELVLKGRELRVPRAVPGFNASAALLSAEVETASGLCSKRLNASDELLVRIHLETAAPDVDVRCGVCFTPRAGGTGLRLQLPEPRRLERPRTYVLTASIGPGTLRPGGYEVRADAIVAGPSDQEASVIARYIGRLRIVGEESFGADATDSSVTLWDGAAAWLLDSEWSIE